VPDEPNWMRGADRVNEFFRWGFKVGMLLLGPMFLVAWLVPGSRGVKAVAAGIAGLLLAWLVPTARRWWRRRKAEEDRTNS
jgi:hypothetical protein